MNDLDRAIFALCRSKSALPELMRRLGEGELWFLVPYHPEVEGEAMELKNGMENPFSMFEDKNGAHVPVFSSFDRLRQAMKAARLPARTHSAASMPAKQLLEVLGKMGVKAMLNKGCRETGEMLVPPDMMRDIADGSALKGNDEPQESVQMALDIIDPADYPTELIQPAFEILRKHRNFRAVWIAERGKGQPPTAKGGRRFQFLLLMEPRDAAICKEFNLVVQSAAPPHEANLGYLDESDTAYVAQLWQQAAPFYVAPDYERSSAAKD